MKSGLLLTQRALGDIQDLFAHSKDLWGKATADKYLNAIERALARLQEQPNLLQEDPELHSALKFYRVNKHLLVCDAQSTSIVVLAVIHASMDIPARLSELQPMLSTEVELLHEKLRPRKPRE
ncbi:MAG: plasmid stabilization system [Planctomycetaceae bacterium]|nr:plasmid stabilization system [Planctomycetaceae bacterium]